MTFTLGRDIFDALISQICFYCGNGPSNLHKHCRRKNEGLAYNGIDRRNSKKGYDIENVVSCCAECNYAKNDTEEHHFYEWISRVHNNLKTKTLI